jgi:hypothetical protein
MPTAPQSSRREVCGRPHVRELQRDDHFRPASPHECFFPCSEHVRRRPPGQSALHREAFGLGTAPLLSAFALGLRRIVARDLRVRRLLAAAVLAASLWSVAMRQGMLGSGPLQRHAEHGAMSLPDTAAPEGH